MYSKIKDKLLTREFILFFVGGVSAFLLDFGLLYFLVYVLSFHPLLLGFISVSNLTSATIAVTYNFFFQRYLAFNTKGNNNAKSELTKFIGVQVFTVLFFGGLVFGLFLNIGLSVLVAKLITTVFQMISSYFLYKYFVFKK